MEVLGIDIGGTGIKGAPVDVTDGRLLTDRFRLLTPQPATPEAVAGVVAELVAHFDWKGPVGCGFPAVVRGGRVRTAANIDPGWIGMDGRALFESRTGCTFVLANDADAAGLAEMRLGAGKDRRGTVLVVTLGTGIGTALFIDGKLVPNTELGHLQLGGEEAEALAADSARTREELGWKKWGKRVNAYLKELHRLLWPELIIVGGGVSKKHHKFLPYVDVEVEVVPAQLRNGAGIIGAALRAAEEYG